MPQTIREDTIIGDVHYAWRVKEYEQHARGNRWYAVSILAGLALIIYGIITGNFIFSLIIILFAIILFLQAHQHAPDVQFAVTELGIVIGSKFYTYSEFDVFYIIYAPPRVKTLFLDTKSIFRPILRVPLLDLNSVDITHSLREFLPEDLEKEDEPIADAWVRNWKIH